jgi:hypothetical protein
MNIKQLAIDAGLLVIIMGLIVISFFVGCSLAPTQMKGESNVCYRARYCQWINRKNPNTSACVAIDAECRAYERWIYCSKKENRPDDCKFQECWDKLNTK